jgi:hypothetical protein
MVSNCKEKRGQKKSAEKSIPGEQVSICCTDGQFGLDELVIMAPKLKAPEAN